jgi:hypothetical protein
MERIPAGKPESSVPVLRWGDAAGERCLIVIRVDEAAAVLKTARRSFVFVAEALFS